MPDSLSKSWTGLQSHCIYDRGLVRNSVVSVFLRKLEYYDAIMFLTTNRVAQFDEAILSRIHMIQTDSCGTPIPQPPFNNKAQVFCLGSRLPHVKLFLVGEARNACEARE